MLGGLTFCNQTGIFLNNRAIFLLLPPAPSSYISRIQMHNYSDLVFVLIVFLSCYIGKD